MKSSLLALLSSTFIGVLAAPNDVSTNGEALAKAIEAAVDMEFIGPAFVGGPNVTITGTSESIYNELRRINPDYSAWDFPEYRERMKKLGISRPSGLIPKLKSTSLAKRGGFNCDPPGGEVGNVGMQCTEGWIYLSELNGYCGAPRGWGGCSRVSCSHNCGIFLCNDNDYEISVWCGNIAGDYADIVNECGREWHTYVVSAKGQVFRDGPPAWNTILKSQSC